MKRHTQFLFLIGCICLSLYAGGQQTPVLKYNTIQGLGHSIVYRIYEDNQGFLLLSTDNGLTRFDGKTFENLTEKDGLRSNFIFDVFENDTSMVAATFGGGFQFILDFKPDSVASLAPEIKFPITSAKDGERLWVVDRSSRLFRLDKSHTKDFTPQIKADYKTVSSVFPSPKGLLVGSYGIYRYSEKTDSLILVHYFQSANKVYVNYLIELENGHIVANCGDAIVLIDGNSNKSKILLKGNFFFGSQNLLQLRDGSILVADAAGNLSMISSDFKTTELILKDIVINDMHEDRYGNLWLATSGDGLWCIPSRSVKQYDLPPLITPDISWHRSTRELCVASRASGMIIFRKEKSGIAPLFDPPLIPPIFFAEEMPTREKIIVQGNNLVRQQGKKVKSIRLGKPFASFFKDSKKQHWVGLRMGLMAIDSSFSVTSYIEEFNSKIVRAVAEGASQQLLVGTNEGLFQKQNDSWIRIGKANGLANEYINDIMLDKKQQTWLATNEGIFVLESTGNVRNVCPELRANNFILDSNSNVWASTSQGLLCVTKDQIRLFSEKEGIPAGLIEIEYDPLGDVLYLLSHKKLSRLEATAFLNEQKWSTPKLFVVSQSVNGQVIANNTTTLLPENASALRIRISYPFFKTAERWGLYYKINNREWVNEGNATVLNLVELAYGQTKVQLQLRDELGNFATEVVTLSYYLPRPWYKSLVFSLGILVLSIGCCIWAAVVITRQLNQKRQRKVFFRQRQLELEQKVLANMLNPHFMNNAINSIQFLVSKNDQRQTLRYLAKFARLMRMTQELLERSYIPLEKEIYNTSLYLEFEVLRFGERLKYKMDISLDVPVATALVPSFVLQPFVENAIWHGLLQEEKGGELSISIAKTNEALVVLIVDNGIGIYESGKLKKSDTKPSRGLTIIRDRFEVLNESYPGHSFTIQDRSEIEIGATGTVVTIFLPLRVEPLS